MYLSVSFLRKVFGNFILIFMGLSLLEVVHVFDILVNVELQTSKKTPDE